jgi:hypothetical protein
MADALALVPLAIAACIPIIPFLPQRWLERAFGITDGAPVVSPDAQHGGNSDGS